LPLSFKNAAFPTSNLAGSTLVAIFAIFFLIPQMY